MAHKKFYWWDRSTSSPKGPFETAEAAKRNVESPGMACPERDILILHEEAYAGSVKFVREWQQA